MLLATVVLAVVAGAVSRSLGLTVFRPEIPLLVALHAGLVVGKHRGDAGRPSWVETTVIGLVAGYLGDLLAGAPIGLGSFACVTVALTARGLADRLLLSTFWRTALVAWFFALGHGAILTLVLAATRAVVLAQQLQVVLAISLASGVVAPLVFSLLDRLSAAAQRPPEYSTGGLR